jgi:adenylate cyclase
VSVALDSLTPCFQGLIPATLFTCSSDGTPNVAYLSHVEYVDPQHVALSFQFFNKSRRNIAENPHALVRVLDPDTSRGWCLRLRYVRSEATGPLFDRMALRIEAIASYCGLKGIFKLLAADIYEVLSVEPAEEELARAEATADRHGRRAAAADPVFTMKALQDLSERIHRADSLERLLDSILAGLEESFGFSHSMILVPTEEDGVLVTIATRGYAENGAGAEARHGEGIIGLVAEARKPIRISGLLREMLYAYAVRKRAQEQGLCPPERRIALPGLPRPESQLGVPLLVRGELVGVLCIESDVPYRFHEEDKVSIELLGSYLAIAIQNMQLQERAEVAAEPPPSPVPAAPLPAAASDRPGPATRSARRDVVYYAADECILVDGEYLIRSLPAKILWKLLTSRQQGRAEFTNRELRLDKSLQLPEWKDNLESRLLLLRRRLEQKCPDIRLVPRARGRFALELGCEVSLSTR